MSGEESVFEWWRVPSADRRLLLWLSE